MKKPLIVDEYIAGFPADVQFVIKKCRETIRKAAPAAEEVISYGMPAYKFHGMLVYFAAHTKHLGLYPMATGIEAFKQELSVYKGARGSVQFPFDKPLPFRLIATIIRFRVKENIAKMELKAMKKKL